MKDCKCKCKFTEELRKSNTAIWLFAVCSFLAGVVLGFFLSPIKKGVKIGCNNGNCTYEKEDDMRPCNDDDDAIKF